MRDEDLLEGVAEREHRHGMDDLGEAARRAGTDAARGRVVAREVRVLRLQRLQLAHQAVVVGIGDVRLVQHVIAIVRILDAAAQDLGALDGFGRGDGLRHVQGP